MFESFSRLGYPEYFLKRSLSKAKQTFYNGPKEKVNYSNSSNIRLPYLPPLLPLQKTLRKRNINLVFKQTNTLSKSLVHNRVSNVSQNKDSGVYVIPCKDCDSVYVGETGRDLSTRKDEHKYACRTGNINNAIANHSLQDGHRIDFDRATLVCHNDNFKERRVIEGALIHQLKTFPGNKSFSTDDDLTSIYICRSAPIRYQDLLKAVPGTPRHLLPRHLMGQLQLQPPSQQPPPIDQPPGPPLRRSERLANIEPINYYE